MNLLKPKFWDKQHLTLKSIILYPFTYILDLRNLVHSLLSQKNIQTLKLYV